jgi:hypothetical protein
VKGVLAQNKEECRKLSACIGFLKACARGQRDLWICSKGSNRSSKSYFGLEEERSRDWEVQNPVEVGGLHQVVSELIFFSFADHRKKEDYEGIQSDTIKWYWS